MAGPGKRRFGGQQRPPSAAILALASILSAVSTVSSVGTAQTGAARRTVWDGAYTEGQADRGTMAFGQSCSGCHALAAEGKAPLVGEPFWKSFAQKTVAELL